MTCENCGDISEQRFCDFCDKLYFKDQNLKLVERKKKEVEPLQDKTCAECKKIYKPIRKNQKFCCTECRPVELTPAEKWLKAKPKVNGLTSNQVAYGFFRKKYGVSNRFRACRG